MAQNIDKIDYLDLMKSMGVTAVWTLVPSGLIAYAFKTDPITTIGIAISVTTGFVLAGRLSQTKIDWSNKTEVFKEMKKHPSTVYNQANEIQAPILQKNVTLNFMKQHDTSSHTTYRQEFPGYEETELYRIGFYVARLGNWKISKDFLKDKSKVLTAKRLIDFQLLLYQREFAEKKSLGREGHEGYQLTQIGKDLMFELSKCYTPTPLERTMLRNSVKNGGTSRIQV